MNLMASYLVDWSARCKPWNPSWHVTFTDKTFIMKDTQLFRCETS